MTATMNDNHVCLAFTQFAAIFLGFSSSIKYATLSTPKTAQVEHYSNRATIEWNRGADTKLFDSKTITKHWKTLKYPREYENISLRLQARWVDRVNPNHFSFFIARERIESEEKAGCEGKIILVCSGSFSWADWLERWLREEHKKV